VILLKKRPSTVRQGLPEYRIAECRGDRRREFVAVARQQELATIGRLQPLCRLRCCYNCNAPRPRFENLDAYSRRYPERNDQDGTLAKDASTFARRCMPYNTSVPTADRSPTEQVQYGTRNAG